MSDPDPTSLLIADEVFDRGVDAVMMDPRLARVRAKLTEAEIRGLVSVVTTATATIVAHLLVDKIFPTKKPVPR